MGCEIRDLGLRIANFKKGTERFPIAELGFDLTTNDSVNITTQ